MAQHEDKDARQSEPAKISDRASQPLTGGYTVAIRRIGPAVEITLTANNEYSGMELYDRLVQSLKNGSLHLELGRPKTG